MKNSFPKISVVMPFYNAEKYIAASIESILQQSFSDFEFIIINDCSTDNSDEIVKKYLSDNRIIYIVNENRRGIVVNLNLGLFVASSDIICRMDGDDIAAPMRLQKQYEFLKNNPDVAAVGSYVSIIDEHGKKIDYRTKPTDTIFIKKNILTYSPLVHPATMFRKEAVIKVGGYRDLYENHEDLDLWARLICNGYVISNISEYLLLYRYHKNSTAHQTKKNAQEYYRLQQQTVKDFNLKINFSTKIIMWIQYVVRMMFTGRNRQTIEGVYKQIMYGSK